MEVIQNEGLQEKFIMQFELDRYFENIKEIPFRLVSFEKGELLSREGEVLKYFSFLLLGKIRVYSVEREEQFRILTIDAPCSVGSEEFLSDPRSTFSVEAVTEILCLQIPMRTAHRILRDDPKFIRFMGQEILKTLNLVRGKGIAEKDDNTVERAYAFLQLSAENGLITRSMGQLSETIGVSYRQMIRIMNQLCEEGKLRHGPKKGNYYLVQED